MTVRYPLTFQDELPLTTGAIISLAGTGGAHVTAWVTPFTHALRVVTSSTLIHALGIFQQKHSRPALETAVGGLVYAAQAASNTG